MDNSLFNVNAAMDDINSHFLGHDDIDDDCDHHHHNHHREAEKAKMTFKRYSNVPPGYTAAVARRNERERNRVRQVNNGFVVLRQKIPFAKSNKKMSKVETLRCAVDYIRQLQQLLTAERTASQDSAAEFSSTTAFSTSTMSPTMYTSPRTSPVTFSSPTTSPVSPHSLDTSTDVVPSTHFYQQDWFNF